jgi:glycosyltransferase involved in cell wall biosynthesis
MAAGRPVVGTTLGLEGLGIEDGQHAQVRDDPRATAEAIVQLIRDDERAQRLANNARKHVETHFDWDKIAPKFADTIQRLATNGAP